MTKLLLLAHAPLATALLRVAEHVFPDCAAELDAIDVDADMDPARLDEILQSRLTCCGDGQVLILVDTFGASPCNAALRAADGSRVKVVAGVNVPMLWRTLCYRAEHLDALVERAVAGGGQGVMHVSVARRQNQSATNVPAGHDQVQHPDQQ